MYRFCSQVVCQKQSIQIYNDTLQYHSNHNIIYKYIEIGRYMINVIHKYHWTIYSSSKHLLY